jgi:stage II sporulation protein B
MNKARITYRFDQSKDREGSESSSNGDTGRVIPLYQEEYEVVDEHTDHGAPSGGGRTELEHEQEPEDFRSFHEPSRPRKERDIRDYQGLNQYTSDFGAWSSPFDAETQRIEELIRESNEREGRRSGPAEGSSGRGAHDYGERRFPESQPDPRQLRDWRDRQGNAEPVLREREVSWSGQEEPPRYNNSQQGPYRSSQRQPEYDSGYGDDRDSSWEGPVVTGPRYVRHNRTPWLKISAAIAGAAVTGVLLGFFALSLFNSPEKAEDGSEVDVVADAGNGTSQNTIPVTGSVQDANSGKASAGAVSSGKEVALAYGGKSYSFLQHGLFSAQQGADQAKSDLVKQGLAAASEQGEKFYVFAGVTTDKDSATVLSKQLKEKNKLDIYVKAYSVPSVTKVRWNGNADTLKSYLEQSDKLIQSINLLTVMNLETGTAPSPIEASTLQSVSTAHTAWSQLSTTVAQEGGEENKAVIQRMNSSMNSAKASLDEYKKNPSTAMLWQAQTYTLQFIIAQKDLLARIGA